MNVVPDPLSCPDEPVSRHPEHFRCVRRSCGALRRKATCRIRCRVPFPLPVSAPELILPVDDPRMVIGGKHIPDEQRVIGVGQTRTSSRRPIGDEDPPEACFAWNRVEIAQREIRRRRCAVHLAIETAAPRSTCLRPFAQGRSCRGPGHVEHVSPGASRRARQTSRADCGYTDDRRARDSRSHSSTRTVL